MKHKSFERALRHVRGAIPMGDDAKDMTLAFFCRSQVHRSVALPCIFRSIFSWMRHSISFAHKMNKRRRSCGDKFPSCLRTDPDIKEVVREMWDKLGDESSSSSEPTSPEKGSEEEDRPAEPASTSVRTRRAGASALASKAQGAADTSGYSYDVKIIVIRRLF